MGRKDILAFLIWFVFLGVVAYGLAQLTAGYGPPTSGTTTPVPTATLTPTPMPTMTMTPAASRTPAPASTVQSSAVQLARADMPAAPAELPLPHLRPEISNRER